MDNLLEGLLQLGILGPVVAAQAYALWHMQKQHRVDRAGWEERLVALQQHRVDDTQKAIERIFELKDSVDELTVAVTELRREMGVQNAPTNPPRRR